MYPQALIWIAFSPNCGIEKLSRTYLRLSNRVIRPTTLLDGDFGDVAFSDLIDVSRMSEEDAVGFGPGEDMIDTEGDADMFSTCDVETTGET